MLDVDGVPGELLALIGAPMPEVDLTIESEEDVERWLSEFLRFGYWLSANPTGDHSVIAVGFVEDSEYFDTVRQGKLNLIEAGVVGLGGHLEVISVLAHYGDAPLGMFRIEIRTRLAEPLVTWSVESEEVVHVMEPDSPTTSVTSDLFVQLRADGTWGLRSWQR